MSRKRGVYLFLTRVVRLQLQIFFFFISFKNKIRIGQNGWILPSFFSLVCVYIHKRSKEERYPAILTLQLVNNPNVFPD